MYTKRIFPVKGVIKWTRRHILLFLLIATIPVFLFDIAGLKWLHVPWLPLRGFRYSHFFFNQF